MMEKGEKSAVENGGVQEDDSTLLHFRLIYMEDGCVQLMESERNDDRIAPQHSAVDVTSFCSNWLSILLHTLVQDVTRMPV